MSDTNFSDALGKINASDKGNYWLLIINMLECFFLSMINFGGTDCALLKFFRFILCRFSENTKSGVFDQLAEFT